MPNENEAVNGAQSTNSLTVPAGKIQRGVNHHDDPNDFERTPQATTVVRHTQRFFGPIPPPEVLAGYDRVQPGFASRIIAMAETENNHRREMERSIVRGGLASQDRQFSEARVGQICAAMITIAALGLGCYTALNGHDVTGGVLGASGVGGIVTTFVLGRSTNRNPEPPENKKRLSKQAARRQRNR